MEIGLMINFALSCYVHSTGHQGVMLHQTMKVLHLAQLHLVSSLFYLHIIVLSYLTISDGSYLISGLLVDYILKRSQSVTTWRLSGVSAISKRTLTLEQFDTKN